MKKLSAIISLITLLASISFSQTSESNITRQHGLYLGIGFSPLQTMLILEGCDSISDLNSKKCNSFSGTIEFGYKFSRFFGISSGLMINPFKSESTLLNYSNKYVTKDSENDTYERIVSGTDINEEQRIAFIQIPFYLNFNIPLGKRFGLFIQPGINLALPISSKYTSSGTFTFQGYYPAYNVLLYDLPEYGFPTAINSTTSEELELKSLILNGSISSGLHLYLDDNTQIGVGAFYARSLIDISTSETSSDFQLSTDVDQIKSMIGGCATTKTQTLGLNIFFRYYFHK